MNHTDSTNRDFFVTAVASTDITKSVAVLAEVSTTSARRHVACYPAEEACFCAQFARCIFVRREVDRRCFAQGPSGLYTAARCEIADSRRPTLSAGSRVAASKLVTDACSCRAVEDDGGLT